MKQRDKLIQRTMDLQRELTREGLTRRNLMKLGVLSAGTGMLLPISGLSLRAARATEFCPLPGRDIISPPTRPWQEELPRLVEMKPIDPNAMRGGAPQPVPQGPVPGVTNGDSKLKLLQDSQTFGWGLDRATPYGDLRHQGWYTGPDADPSLSRLIFPPAKYYEMTVKQANHVWHRDLPAGASGQPAWGFVGTGQQVPGQLVPGPMFRTRYGEPILVRIHNELPPGASALGFGSPLLTTHLHNLHTPSESDGNPLYYNYPGDYWDHHYPNVYAGVNQYGGIGDSREALGTIWYHDHKLDFTAQNVYAGLAGMNSIYDDLDTGDPTESSGLRLPCGPNYEFDVGLAFHDRQFDPQGLDFFPLTCFDGAIGDKMTVNGRIQPKMIVKRRRYRFRMLNFGPSRFYWWFLRRGTSASFLPVTVIGNDGNLLPKAVAVSSFKQGVAERFDIVIDFSGFAPGTELFLVNRAEQVSGRGPTGAVLNPGIEVLKFVVSGAAVVDNSLPVPFGRILRPLPDMNQPVTKTQHWLFDREGGEWSVNDRQFDRNAPPYEIPEGPAENWLIENEGGSWSHPVHIHYEEHRFLSYNNAARPDPTRPLESGRKDVIRLDPNALVSIYMRFRDYKGLYPMHCHNVVHEDHAMMVMWKIV
ncbi:MAG TPA: multicopper oxidase domain-containing protein [Burkholderiales bacterium]